MMYGIKIRPPSSEEPVIWGYFSLMDDPKCANKERLVIRLVPTKQLAEMDRYDHNMSVSSSLQDQVLCSFLKFMRKTGPNLFLQNSMVFYPVLSQLLELL